MYMFQSTESCSKMQRLFCYCFRVIIVVWILNFLFLFIYLIKLKQFYTFSPNIHFYVEVNLYVLMLSQFCRGCIYWHTVLVRVMWHHWCWCLMNKEIDYIIKKKTYPRSIMTDFSVRKICMLFKSWNCV